MARKFFGIKNGNAALTARSRQDNIILARRRMPEDGWVRDVYVEAGGVGAGIVGRLVLYDGETDVKLWQSAAQVWGVGRQERHGRLAFGQRGERQRKGQILYVGFFRRPDDDAVWGYRDQPNRSHFAATQLTREPENDLGGLGTYGGNLAAYIEYIPNLRPLQGEWTNSTPDSDNTPLNNNNFLGTMPQQEAEEGYDQPTNFQIRIFDRADGEVVYRETFEVSGSDLFNDRFNRNINFPHVPGHDYWADFRHQDSWGTWSPLSNKTFYTARSAPNAPTNFSPADGEKVDVQDVVFSGNYSHEEGVASADVKLRVWNRTRTLEVRESDWLAMTGTSFFKALSGFGLAVLPWGFNGFAQAQFRDFNGSPGRWSTSERFRTNSAPRRPVRLSPSNGEDTTQTTLVCYVNDPDGDDIQNVYFQISDTGGVISEATRMVAGPFSPGSRVELDLSTELALGTVYEWKVYAADGVLGGSWTELQSFIYSSVPTVTLIGPPEGLIVNRLLNPSAEEDIGQIADWYSNPGSVLSRLSDGDTYDGEYAFEITKSGGDGSIRSRLYEIDPAKPTVFAFAAKDADSANNPITNAALRLQLLTPTDSDEYISGKNLLSYNQSSAEDGTGAGWAAYGVSLGGTASTDSRGIVQGDFCFQAKLDNSAGATNAIYGTQAGPIPITEGETFTLSGTVFSPYLGRTIRVGFSWRDANDGDISPTTYSEPEITESAQEVSVTGTAPATAAFVRVHFAITDGNDGEFFFFDVAQLEVSGTKTAFETGSQGTSDLNNANMLALNGPNALVNEPLDSVWSVYKGYLNPADYPADVTRARVVFYPETLDEVATARFDAGLFTQAENAITDPAVLDWLSYFDGDREDEDFYWEGSPHYSQSYGLPILDNPQTSLVFDYYSSGGTLKAEDRVVVQRLVNDEWVQSGATSWEASDRTSIPLPAQLFLNKETQRIRAEVRDANGLEGKSTWVLFEADFKGPPALNLYQVSGSNEGGYAYLRWEPSEEPSVDFVGYEVKVETDKNAFIADVIPDQDVEEFFYHGIRSEESVQLSVRQKTLVDGRAVAGDWRSGVVDSQHVSWFVKSINDPNSLNYGFLPLSDQAPSTTFDRTESSVRVRGRGTTTKHPTLVDEEQGTLTINVEWDDFAEENYNKLMEVIDERFVILQSLDPNKVRYVYLGTPKEALGDLPWFATITVDFQETYYQRDYYIRTGEDSG